MKELLLYRHAKAEKSAPGEGDRERKLAPRGELQARVMGRMLREAAALPDLVLSSDALRAVETATVTLRESGCGARLQSSSTLYDADPDDLEAELRSIGENAERIMLVGHNPAMEEFAARLIRKRVEMKTANLVRFSLDIVRWNDFGAETRAKLIAVMVPEIPGS